MSAAEVLVFGGSGSRRLSAAICARLGREVGQAQVVRFSEGSLLVRVLENVRGREVYVVQSTAFPANDNFMELLFWVDALKRSSAASVTVVMPYFGYAKGDKKDEPGVSIRARVCADALEAAGASRVVTLELHAPQIQGFFRVPVDDLTARSVLCEAVREKRLGDLVVVAPDAGFVKRARKYATELGAELAIATKERVAHDERAEIRELVGEVAGRAALVVDDFSISGGTLVKVSELLVERGAREVWAAVSHGVFAAGSMARIAASPIRGLLMTDTVETQPEPLADKVEVVSVAPLLAAAIERIHTRESLAPLG